MRSYLAKKAVILYAFELPTFIEDVVAPLMVRDAMFGPPSINMLHGQPSTGPLGWYLGDSGRETGRKFVWLRWFSRPSLVLLWLGHCDRLLS